MAAKRRAAKRSSSEVSGSGLSSGYSLVRLQDFIGNQELVSRVKRASLPQSALFAGPEGVGKKTLALGLATRTDCRNRSGEDFCGNCESCLKVAGGNHPDIRLFQATGTSIGIETIRQLIREARFRPFQGACRVFIVDQAEKMTREAANSILKTLEEPADTSRIILTTAFPNRLLPTIRSRCQLFVFRSLSRNQLRSYLEIRYGAEEAEQRAAFAGGSIGRALRLDLEQTLQDRDRVLTVLQQWLSNASFTQLFEACEEEPLRRDLKSRDRVREHLETLRHLGEDLYFLRTGTESRMVNLDRRERLLELAERVDLDWIRDLLYHLREAREDLDRNVQPLFCFETLWLKLAGRV
jgi:DNA polymerase-3 subunit delta'